MNLKQMFPLLARFMVQLLLTNLLLWILLVINCQYGMSCRVLEYEETFPESNGPVTDLDWTFLSASKMKLTSNALLSVGFSRFVLLYTQLRYDYTNKIQHMLH